MLGSALLTLGGCLWLSPDDLGRRLDGDDDGVTAAMDCDDADPATGEARSWYLDGDGDGFGDPGEETVSCTAPTDRHLATGEDCDDADATVFPGAPELCDGQQRDEDCDGLTDDDDDDALLTTWYRDQDLDTWGTDDDAVSLCEAGEGWSQRDGDCDDANDQVHPGMDELCGDGIDQDCLPTPSCRLEGDYLVATVDGGIGVSLDDPGVTSGAFGTAAAALDDFDGDGLDDFAVGASSVDATLTIRENGAIFVFSSPPIPDGSASQALVTLLGAEAGARAGSALAACPDLDGDGLAELLIGAPGAATGAGEVTVLFGGAGALDAELAISARQTLLTAEATGDRAGRDLQPLGDFDGDGLTDFAVAAPGRRLGGSGGAVYLVLDQVLPDNAYALDDLGPRIDGDDDGGLAEGYGLGEALTPGQDTNGDGYDDLFLGDPSHDGEQGRALLFQGRLEAAELLGTGDAQVHVIGAGADALLGTQVLLTHALAGDGPELVVSAPLADDTGSTSGIVFLVPVPVNGGTVDLAVDPAQRIAAGDQALVGLAMAGGGDLNGDGAPELAIQGAHQSGQDTVNVFYGPLEGSLSVDDAPLRIASDGTSLGTAIGLGRDLTGDGLDDLLVGAPTTDPDGAVWILPGLGE